MGRIPRKCDFMAGWDSGYTRPPRKENQKIRLGGAHGLVGKKGGFKGLRTWNISAQVSRVKGIESKGRSGAFCEYIERDKECVIGFGDTGQEGKEKYKEIEANLRQKNGVIQRRFVIPLPKEILNNPSKVEKLLSTLQTRYFSSCYAFSAALHKSENFKNPHVHIQYSNVDAGFKAIREFRDPALLDEVKKDIKNFIEAELKIKCEMKGIGKSIKHYPKWVAAAYKRAEADKSGKLMNEYAERYPLFAQYISERKRKLYERAIQLKENKLKKTIGAEAMCVEEFSEKIKKRADGFLGKFYNKKEKEGIKQDLSVNEEIINDLKKKAHGLNFAAELEEREEKERLEKERKKAENQTLKTEDVRPGIKPEDLKTESVEQKQDFGRDKNKEMQRDAFAEDLERRLNKGKGLGR
ncbi:MAG: hypothetical protein M0016_00265 [Deltaproteobacteria bacterium]|jgi:hypothetical protein|nr:hypothetical protein [Deltaproteobacteria bacterium]MCL5880938.1 hypothetical protein [Deltaproteobacteria bacterium]MDA8303594.1 hypothetical protein [Deltaproteobacteria bacterium]